MTNLYFAQHNDFRGSHMKFFTRDTASLNTFGQVSEVFMTTNYKGTLRGLHRQTGNFPQQKIIKVVNGTFNVRVVYPKDIHTQIYNNNATHIDKNSNGDVIVYFDMRISQSDPILIPKGALLGYCSLQDNSKMLYIADNPFSAKDDEGYNAYDPRFNIDWGLSSGMIIRGERDVNAKNY